MTTKEETSPDHDSHLVIFVATVLEKNRDELIDRWIRALKPGKFDGLYHFMRTLLFVPLKLKFSDNGKTLWLYSKIVPEFTLVFADAEKAGMAKTMLKLSKQKFSDFYLSQVSLYIDMQYLVERALACIICISTEEVRLSLLMGIKGLLEKLQQEFRHSKISEIESNLHAVFLAESTCQASPGHQ